MYQIDKTNRYGNALKKLASKDKQLFAEVLKKTELLKKGINEGLVLKPIMRKTGKYEIQEIVIRQPSSYRVFFVIFKVERNKILLVDGRKKKVPKFKSEYFKILDKCIDEHFKKNWIKLIIIVKPILS